MNKEKIRGYAIRGVTAGAAIVGSFFLGSGNSADSAQATQAQAFSVDMDPNLSPANMPSSLGTRELCAQVNENGQLDADEESIDTLEFDVTVTELPQSTKMIAFAFSLTYPQDNFIITGKNIEGLLSTAPNYSGFDASKPLPSFDGNLSVSVADINAGGAFGSGFLARIQMETTETAETGNYKIFLLNAGHVDRSNASWAPTILENAQVALNESCKPLASEPPATATPTTPTVPTALDKQPYLSGPAQILPRTGGPR
jgi:hypothetical protein